MDEILDDVKKLSINELRAKLVELGENVGPIVPTTKLLFQKKLARKLYELSSPSTQHPSIDRSLTDGSSPTSESDLSQRPSSPPPKACNENNQSKEGSSGHTVENESSVFFGVSLPQGTENSEGNELVYTDKEQALKAVKKFSGARFKVFKTKTEAERFSLQHAEEICPSPWKQNGPKSENGAIATLGTGVSVESSPFKGPKAQELTKLRKTIEEGDVTTVESIIWDNPRYLISGGDTPVILQEGPRYNALHVAARTNQASICQLILDTLEDPSFMDKLYGHTMETDSTRSNRISFVIDLYLNTPDKGGCESPLHFACKFGFPEVVAVLVSHPKTDKFLRNRYGETPKDVICSRASNPSEAMKVEIKELLEGQYFIPLIRSEDNTTQPVIGTPWSPEYNRGGSVGTPPTSWSPKDPLMAVKACAGPMTPAKAQMFHRRWTTPPSGSPDYIKRKFVMTKREDSEKGLERIGRELAREMNVPWVEYWDFLQTYADLTTEDGLDLLEEYLQKQSLALCIEEALGKLQLLSNSNHSFMYNQMNVSQQSGSVSSMASSWLMSPLEGIVESRHEGLSEIEEITNEDLLERLQGNRPTLSNGGIPRAASDVMRKSVRMD
ncbi:hypothetical protein FSP39_025313 [Pinctada imbricata]|uniref:LEM domain-containing protein n=1 Tax=Pinctada imbricata TaxID=66713 RepID=A0AA88YFW0_PINIB|nr:hypothetical protein FSP39_025313 [Pinctada imbricata]